MTRSGEKEKCILETLNKHDPEDKKFIIRYYESFEYKRHLCLKYELLD